MYQDRVCALAQEECIIGRFMRECGKVDPTEAGKLMTGSGKTLLFASHQFILLRNILIRVYRDVQTFQYRAVTDTFDTVDQMEKARTAYRAALLWMKDISKQLDPDAYNQMDKFKKVQNHVRKTKKVFEKLKIDTIQKTDLLSASRCNLFSNVLANYQNNLQNIWEKSSKVMNIFVNTFRSSPQSYEFTMLKELNNDATDERFETFEARLKEILAQDNINEKDMLVFFEADYTDERDTLEKKSSSKETRPKSNAKLKNENEPKRKDKSSKLDSSLLDLNFENKSKSDSDKASTSAAADLLSELDISGHFMPSSLIDLDHMHRMDHTELPKSDFDQFLSWPIHKGSNNVATNNNTAKVRLFCFVN